MPKGKKNYTTPHVCNTINNPRKNIPSEHDQNARYRLQQSALDSFHAEIYGPVFLSVGPEAKLDMYNNFDLDKPFDLQLDPSSSEDPSLCRIIQEGKDPILTTDFYLTNIEPRPWILPTPPPNKDTPEPSGAAAADKFTPVIEPDPVQPGEIRLHSWMLYTPQVPVLDLREETITSDLDLRGAFHQLYLCPEEDVTHPEQCPNGRRKSKKSKQLSDSDTSKEEQVNPIHKTSKEERHYWTICGSALATQIALSHSRAQANPTVKRGPSRKVRIKKLPKDKAEYKSTQTSKETKQTK